jgi:hypothetical protein
VGRILEASVWTTREWISKLWAKNHWIFWYGLHIIHPLCTKYKVSIKLIIILNSIFKNIFGAKKKSSPLALNHEFFFYKSKKSKRNLIFVKILKFLQDVFSKPYLQLIIGTIILYLKQKLCPKTWIWISQNFNSFRVCKAQTVVWCTGPQFCQHWGWNEKSGSKQYTVEKKKERHQE